MSKAPYSAEAEWFWPRKESTWHKLRKPDITATSAAALFGCSPYMTPFDLFHRMAGNITVEFNETERMLWGKRLQNAIAQGVCEDNGWLIVDAHPFLYARSKAVAGMGASPDYIITDPARPELGYGCLEIKNVDFFVAGKDWSDEEAPPHIEFQVQHQLAVTGFLWGAVAGLIGGNTVKTFRRDRDAEVIAELTARIEDMHSRVKRGEAPAADYLADYETIRTLYRHATVAKSFNLDLPGEEPDLDPEKLKALMAAKYDADIIFKAAEEDKKRAAAELLDFIKDTETVFGGGWKLSAGTVHREASTITYPAISFRNLRLSKPKPKKGN
ncbi:YqaJ viral recombinase family protein [Mesorhizobium sp. CA14]|uniref:YqaJ viral recombinase family nuclease n=1 Tax=Mesorhizobium sp. CA14 TaxID=2876642 RepID=UPI001CCFCE5E|nr:YqaJ viral recombinase family protein [Mesorhizobium sp. CA14]MBZ9847179.1 YqaJ viral recombinase family protein [Mesorhizobium sp. CA14]